jgi:hypothetical protein
MHRKKKKREKESMMKEKNSKNPCWGNKKICRTAFLFEIDVNFQ